MIEPEYKIGETVYIQHDPAQEERMVTGLLYSGDNNLLYRVECYPESSFVGAGELSREKNILRQL